MLKRETKSYDQFHFDSIKLYHGGNKLSVIELMMRSAFYQTNKISWNFIVLADRNVTPLGHFILKPIRTPWSHGNWTYHHWCCEFEYRSSCTTLCDKICQWLATLCWFSTGPPFSSTNKTDRHDITEILLKVALNSIKQNWFRANQSLLFLLSAACLAEKQHIQIVYF